MNHHWTSEDFETLRREHLAGTPTREIAAMIGAPAQSTAVYLSRLGITRQREACQFCQQPVTTLARGRKPQFCSADCNRAYHAAYATNARIDGREITHCEGCGAKLIPPWSAKKKWCSKACGSRGWYESVQTNAERKKRHYKILKLSLQRSRVLESLPDLDYDWLLTIREAGDAPAYWMRKLRQVLMLETRADLIRYARAIRI